MEPRWYENQGSRKGLVIVNTGPGKGKRTAALGMVMRAWGHGMRACVIQFLKQPSEHMGGAEAARRLDIEWYQTGSGFTWVDKTMDNTTALARGAWELAKQKIASQDYDLIVLDEFTYPLLYDWLDIDDIVAWLKESKPPLLHLVITGRGAPPELKAYADLVTEMGNVKHPFDRGIQAQPAIDF